VGDTSRFVIGPEVLLKLMELRARHAPAAALAQDVYTGPVATVTNREEEAPSGSTNPERSKVPVEEVD